MSWEVSVRVIIYRVIELGWARETAAGFPSSLLSDLKLAVYASELRCVIKERERKVIFQEL